MCFLKQETALVFFHGPPGSLRRVVAANYYETNHEAIRVVRVARGHT